MLLATISWCGLSSSANLNHAPSSDKSLEDFKASVYPLLKRSASGCFDCHSTDSNSELVFSGNAEEDLQMLIDGQYLGTGPDSLISRLTSSNEKLRMPKDDDAWQKNEIGQLKSFIASLTKARLGSTAVDEQFPRALLLPYSGPRPTEVDNQFISYRQLKAKIEVIFEDDWVRQGIDRFAENVALFGGADFKTRFNESRVPNAAFLTGLEMLADDVAHDSYEQRRGPFKQWRNPSASPLESKEATEEYRDAISRLYESVLFRLPTKKEIANAYTLLQDIYRTKDLISVRNHQLAFELKVADPESGFERTQIVEIPVNGDRLEIHQQIIDESGDPSDNDKSVGSCVIGPVVELSPDTLGQRLVIHNLGTHQNVSISGVKISSLDGDDDRSVTLTTSSPDVQIDGAWEQVDRDGHKSLEDRNNHKGLSTVTFPLKVKQEGRYRVTMMWRADPGNANNVFTELFAKGAGNRLVSSISPTLPDPGEAHLTYDCGDDAVAFFQPEPTFQFDNHGYVEISNRSTRKRVTAGAVEFLDHIDRENRFLIDSREAEGNESWATFDEGAFRAYNVKGQKLHDDNKQKGELSLRYAPAANASENASEKQSVSTWNPELFYDVRIYFPGKANQESQVPVVVKANKSSPVIQLEYPPIAKSDAVLRLDASKSYTVQQSKLQFSWRQISGLPVELGETSQPVIEFLVPRPDINQFAWSSLCAGLIRHPDFLFTRPPTFFSTVGLKQRQKMQLVKISLDLVGRPPSSAELKMLDEGQPLGKLIDDYLDSGEFREFYFHRIRLMLESHGTEMQDEPARVWSYVAFNDRPFQEILTGEYTVNKEFKRQARPTYHGKTGLLTTTGFIQGKPGLPHYNYAAQVSMLFLGYVYDVPDDIVEQREGVTALGTTDPNSACYSCHKVLTPLAFQRMNWTDEGLFRTRDENDLLIDATDRGCVAEYAFPGKGMEAFATQAVRKERFIRTMINTHINFYFGRPLRHREDERVFYKQLWDHVHSNGFKIRELIRAIMNSPEYQGGGMYPVRRE